jgi:predicted nuclease with TOPRIM domain
MPKSKASVDGDEQRQELQLLKQDVEENQNELSAIRAELSTVSCKQDQFTKAMDGMQGAVSDLSQQVSAMADTLQFLRPFSGKQPANTSAMQGTDDLQTQGSPGAANQAALQQKRQEVEALRRQYAMEQELSRLYQ